MNWQERTGSDENQASDGIIGILHHMVNNADAPKDGPSLAGGKLRSTANDVTLYTGAAPQTFEKLARTLTVLLGEPTEHEAVKIPNSDEVESQRYKFPGDVAIVYMAFRDSGISINIPKKSLPLLSEKLAQHEAGLEGGAKKLH